MAYSKDTDYKKLIEKAASSGDYRTAAKLEQQRNEKIKGEGLSYGTTSDYAGWLDKNDYGSRIKSAIGSGGSRREVAGLLKKRVDKASSTKGMEQWAGDDIYDMAIEYLTSYDMPEYQSRYAGRIDSLIDKLTSRGEFSYDYKSDPLYAAYAEAYQREGKRAAQDALGMAAQNTGGYASSYAASAAQQAGSYYSAKQADKIPELYKLAYDVYMDGMELDMDSLSALAKLDQQEYQRYRDTVDDAYRRQQEDYDRYLNSEKLRRQDEQLEYDRSRDSLADSRYDSEWAYKLGRDEISDRRYEEQQALKNTAAAAKSAVKSTAKSASSKSRSSGGDDGVQIYGLTGTYSREEAEAMVAIGLAQRFRQNGKSFYKLAAMG